MENNILKRYIRLVAVAFLLLSSTWFCFAFAGDSGKKIKVGYYEQEVFQEGAGDGLVKKGYAYEYYRKLSDYTGFEYEYVYGNFPDLYEKLLDGKIDLLAGLAYTKERAEKIFYENLPMGSTYYYLLKKINDYETTRNPDSLNGKRIGVQKSIMVKILEDWIKDNSVKAEVVVFNSFNEMDLDFSKEKLDLIMVEGSGTLLRNDADAVFNVGKTDYYLCVSRQRNDIVSEINAFHKKLLDSEPGYLSDLFNKYYPKSISGRAFSSDELEYIRSLEKLRIGYLNNYLPYCDSDSTGELTGCLKDILPLQLMNLGILNRIKIEYIAFDSFKDMILALRKDDIDIAFPVGGGLYFSEENGFYQSNPVFESSVALVYSGKTQKSSIPVFAVNKNNDMQFYYVKSNFPEAHIAYYDSIDECLEAINKGKADFTTVNGMRVTAILKNTRNNNLEYRFLRQSDERCYGVKARNEMLLHVINRGIGSVSEQYALNQAYKYTDLLHEYSVWDYIRSILYVLIPVIILTGIVVLVHSIKTKRAFGILNSKLKSALDSKEKYIADMIRYASSEADADMILSQLVEYIGNNSKPDRVYVFEENERHSFDNTYEWCNEGITREKDNLQDIPYEGVLDVWINEFNRHGKVIIDDIETYKSVSKEIYEILKPQGIETLVAIPIKIKGKIIGFIGVDDPPVEMIHEVSKLLNQIEFLFSLMIRMRNAAKSLEIIALYDQLTGVYNRRAYEEAINECMNNSTMKSFAYVSIDVNGLKVVNDTIGHKAGDELICGASKCMKQAFASFGKVYRIGGDEFIAMLRVDKEQLDQVKKTFRKTCEEWKGAFVEALTVSCGYVYSDDEPGLSLHEIILLADKRMYESKSAYYRKSGVDRRGQQEVHKALCNLYTKILKVNLTEDSYCIINMFDNEKKDESGFDEKISEWLRKFGESGQVHPEDLEEYLRLTDLEYMRSYFVGNKKSLHIFYRRKYENGFKKVMMEIIQASDYSDENQNLYLYVKDIDK